MADKKTKTETKKADKINVTPELRRIWLTVKEAWIRNSPAFTNTLGLLTDKQANLLYNMVKFSVYRGSYVEILHEHPELRSLILSDTDRFCMHDIYDHLSRRLDKQVELPPDANLFKKLRGRIGREL